MTTSVPSTTITVGGTPTVFLPLSTRWPAGDDCTSNLYLYTPVNTPNTYLAWDPIYGRDLVTSLRSCLPPQVSTWWRQPSSSIYTALGPKFTCPEAYSAVHTAIVASSLYETYCCPSGYSFVAPLPNTALPFPSQCVSTVTSGDKLVHVTNQRLTNQSTTTVSMTTPAVIVAIPVNGFDFTISTTSISTTVKATTTTTGTATVSSTPAQDSGGSSSDSSSTSGISAGGKAGAAVGSIAGVALIAVGAFLLWRRRRQRRAAQTLPSSAAAELPYQEPPKELSSEREPVYELPAQTR